MSSNSAPLHAEKTQAVKLNYQNSLQLSNQLVVMKSRRGGMIKEVITHILPVKVTLKSLKQNEIIVCRAENKFQQTFFSQLFLLSGCIFLET